MIPKSLSQTLSFPLNYRVTYLAVYLHGLPNISHSVEKMCYDPPNPTLTPVFSFSVEGNSLAPSTTTDISAMMRFPASAVPTVVVSTQGCWACEVKS